ncbi:LCP family protein [Streptantibioticus ferralitis]|uniref:LCP family protein n=1 Tax=Streptantibioticus ferralitis TaxID=236510 RepID=A0ABT5YXK0_9ACTN|nr:LCP family protein [Streptantibioticus ferralitis]MDF2256142.1 LCP family protein [Streptantibioticus ferralitis]
MTLAVRITLCCASALVLVASGMAWGAYHYLTGGLNTSDALDAVRGRAPAHLDNSVNLLLIGLDSRKDMDGNDLPKQFVEDELHAGSSDIGGYNTNTLILMHIPANGGKVTAFSVPRDDYVQVLDGDGTPGGMHKMKEAYGLAKAAAEDRLAAQGVKGADLEHQSREVGREATLATVQQFLGVPIDHFAEVNLLGFYDITKVLQPIQVCLRQPVHDRYSGADFPAGYQELNPRQALAFVRQRHGLTGGDLDRTHRQQAFLSSVTHKLKVHGIFGDLSKLQGLLDVVKQDLVIDSSWNVLDFAQQAPNLTGGNVEFHTLPIAGFAQRGGESVNLVDPEQIRSIVGRMIGQDPATTGARQNPPASGAQGGASLVVDVRNGSGVSGAAATESKALTALGYTAGEVTNAPEHATTTVVYGAGAQDAARQIAPAVGVAAPLASAAVPAGHVVVTLGAGFNPQDADESESDDVPPPPAASPASFGRAAASDAPDPVPTTAFQGQTVKMGGIPCVD